MRTQSTRRRQAPAPLPFVELGLLILVAGGVAAGFADPERAQLPVPRALGLGALPALIAIRSWTAPSLAARRGRRTPLWVGGAVVLAAVLVQAGGGPSGLLAVAGFLAVGAASLSVGAMRTLPWTAVLAGVVLLPIVLGQAAETAWASALAWALGLVACAVIPGSALQAERTAHQRTITRLRTLEDEAGGLRHESSEVLPNLRGGGYGEDERERDLRSIARTLQGDIERAAATVVAATGARTASVYRPDGEEFGDRLVVVASAGDVRDLIESVGVRDGLFGAAFKAAAPVCLRNPRPDDPRVVHRTDCAGLGSVLALPLMDGDRRFGMMMLDAPTDVELDGHPRELAGDLADFLARLIARAVDLSAIREGMRENHAFYEACRTVSRHVRIEDIAKSVVDSAGRFVPLDRCAFALADDSGATLRVVASTGFAEPPTEPFPIRAEEGLLAQAVRHRTMIDRPDVHSTSRAPVLFGQRAGAESGLWSLLVLPVYAPGGPAEDTMPPLGALVVARDEAPDFSHEDAERLEVLLHQAGASISNGRLFAEHEARSITDGMTGLPNHRRFQEVLDEKLARCARTRHKLTLLLMDIDKFKSVNDTYGHPMGDEVIRRLARVLEDAVRGGTDLAARYGGEEFCVVLEDADAGDALILADRLREAFKSEQFVYTDTDGARPTTFRCSMSVGIACFPDDGSEKADLIEKADQALYMSKQRGRDRATCYEALRAVGATAKPEARA